MQQSNGLILIVDNKQTGDGCSLHHTQRLGCKLVSAHRPGIAAHDGACRLLQQLRTHVPAQISIGNDTYQFAVPCDARAPQSLVRHLANDIQHRGSIFHQR